MNLFLKVVQIVCFIKYAFNFHNLSLIFIIIIIIMFLGKCYVDEVFQFSLLKSLLHLPTPQTIRSKPRQSGGLKKV